GRHRNRALIVISDGLDNMSLYSSKEVRDFLKETEITVHAIALGMDSPLGLYSLGMDSWAMLEKLTDLSGGSSFFRRGGRWRADELRQAFEMITGSLRSQYRIRVTPVYKPTEKWHRLKIKINVPDPPKELKDLSARAREGFYLVPARAKQ
ncbi:MAG TPA: hypothetical protein VFH31_16325, partial [Pyrinomonadaceae bacterium]|nr:hypothetical protein [Pyrinomonadaceae bacterium]